MREIQLLATRGRLSAGDLIAMSREVAADMSSRIMGPEDLTANQQALLIAWLQLLTDPIDVELYFTSSLAA